MTFSSRLFNLLLALALLASCSAAVDESVSDGGVSSQIHLNTLALESTQEEFNDALSPLVATDKNFTIKACLVDSALLLSLPGKRFVVAGKSIATDGSGCLRFNQKVELSYKETSRYQRFQTVISEEDSGEFVTASYAINPWDGTFVNIDAHPDFESTGINALKSDENEGFSVEGLSVSFGGFIGAINGGAREGQVLSKVNAYSRIPVNNGKALGGQTFKVTIVNEESGALFETQLRSESNGQILIPVPTTFEQHAPNHWIKNTLTLEAVGGPFDGQIKSNCYFINPWQTSGLFGWECARGTPPEAANQSTSKLFLDTMKFNYMGNDPDGFRINNYLELSMVKSYLIEMIPYVKLNHDFMGDMADRRIMSGRFKMSLMVLWPRNGQLALTPENKDNFEFLTGITKEVEVLNGLIRTQVDLNFNFYDLPKAATRTMAVVKLESLDDPDNLEAAIVSGPFISTSRNFNSFLVSTESATEQKLDGLGLHDPIIESFSRIAEVPFKEPPLSPWRHMKGQDIFDLVHQQPADGIKLKAISAIKQKTLMGLTPEDVTSLLTGNTAPELMRKLCPLVRGPLVQPPERYRSLYRPILGLDMREMDCQRTPQDLFKIRVFKNIVDVTEQPRRVYSSTDRMAVGVGFQISEQSSDRVSDSWRYGMGTSLSAKISIPFLDWISLGGGVNYDYSHQVSRDLSTSSAHQASGNRIRFMYAEELAFSFKAKTTTCAIIEVMPSRLKKDNLERFKICDHKEQEESLQESWYYIGEDTLRMSIIRDQFSYDENQLIKLVRGKVNFEQFFNLMGDETKIIFLKKKDEIQSTEDYSRIIYRDNQNDRPITLRDMAIPGVIELAF